MNRPTVNPTSSNAETPAPSDRCAHEAAVSIRKAWPEKPSFGLILGTGLGRVAAQIETACEIPYLDISHFPHSTALSHRGRLVCGHLAGRPVVAMEGRSHLYEGYSLDQLSLPVRAMRELGIHTLILSNASGGLNPKLASGDVLLIQDHIDLMFGMPAVCSGAGDFDVPQRSARIYDHDLLVAAERVARSEGFAAYRGVYAAVSGPNYETRAEYRFLRRIGADAVGMSTVPEAIAAARCGLRILALSIVTNVAKPDCPHIVKAEDVVAAAEAAEEKLRTIVLEVVASG